MPDLRIIGAFSIIPPIIIALAQAELYKDWIRRLIYFPVQFIVGGAIVLSNSKAVLAAFHKPGIEREFKRTPKFRVTQKGQQWIGSHYALKVDTITIGELLLALYALIGFLIALDRLPFMAPYMFVYAAAFTIFRLLEYLSNPSSLIHHKQQKERR